MFFPQSVEKSEIQYELLSFNSWHIIANTLILQHFTISDRSLLIPFAFVVVAVTAAAAAAAVLIMNDELCLFKGL